MIDQISKLKDHVNVSIYMKAVQVNAPINVNPEGGGVGQGVGI